MSINPTASATAAATPPIQWKDAAWRKKMEVYLSLISADWNKYNTAIRNQHTDNQSAPHVEKTREWILRGADHLNKERSVVLVIGAQYFGPVNEPIEPLKELLGRCKQLILVDFDEATLKTLAKTLNDPKVVTRKIDLSAGFYNTILSIASLWKKEYPKTYFLQQYDKLLEDSATWIVRNMEILAEEILEDPKSKVDYVISSLVNSEVFAARTRILNFVTQQLFKTTMPELAKEFPLLSARIAQQEMTVHSLFLCSHIDLLCSLVNETGKIYFADNTTIILHGNTKMTDTNLYSSVKKHIKKMKCSQKKRQWNWKALNNKYEVTAWIFSGISSATAVLDPELKAGAIQAVLNEEADYIKAVNEAKAKKESTATTAAAGTATAASKPPIKNLDSVD